MSDHIRIVDYFLQADKDFLVYMGVDIAKLPGRQEWLDILDADFALKTREKKFFYIIWLLDNQPVGHSNINKIEYANEAYMHLHLWQSPLRQKGIGLKFLQLAIPIFFDIFKLKNLFCEPSAANPAPNRALEKLGFDLIRSYHTIPGWINSYQAVNKWCLSREKFESLFPAHR